MSQTYRKSPFSGSLVVITGTVTADAEVDTFTIPENCQIVGFRAINQAAVGASGDTLTLKNGSDTVSVADLNGVADKATTIGSIDDAYWTVTAGSSISVTAAEASSVDSTYIIDLLLTD